MGKKYNVLGNTKKGNNQIISTFPGDFISASGIRAYLKNNEEFIILSSYAKCSLSELADLEVTRIWTENGKNEYGGEFNEYWKIRKKPPKNLKYFNMLENIKKENIDMTKLYILSCMDISDKELSWQMMNFAYDVWVNADVDLDLSRLADIIVEHWEEIQNDEIFENEIIEICLDI
ncbi:MAG: hypothetical protein ACI4VQ_02370 [Clostridia bacterium]